MTTPLIIRTEEMRARVCRLIAGLDLKKPWEVTVGPYKKRRSLNQNSLHWKRVGIIAQETGNDADVVHDFLKDKFLIPNEVEIAGEKRLCRSSAILDTHEMSDFMEQIYAWAAQELGILLPVPEDTDPTLKPTA